MKGQKCIKKFLAVNNGREDKKMKKRILGILMAGTVVFSAASVSANLDTTYPTSHAEYVTIGSTQKDDLNSYTISGSTNRTSDICRDWNGSRTTLVDKTTKGTPTATDGSTDNCLKLTSSYSDQGAVFKSFGVLRHQGNEAFSGDRIGAFGIVSYKFDFMAEKSTGDHIEFTVAPNYNNLGYLWLDKNNRNSYNSEQYNGNNCAMMLRMQTAAPNKGNEDGKNGVFKLAKRDGTSYGLTDVKIENSANYVTWDSEKWYTVELILNTYEKNISVKLYDDTGKLISTSEKIKNEDMPFALNRMDLYYKKGSGNIYIDNIEINTKSVDDIAIVKKSKVNNDAREGVGYDYVAIDSASELTAGDTYKVYTPSPTGEEAIVVFYKDGNITNLDIKEMLGGTVGSQTGFERARYRWSLVSGDFTVPADAEFDSIKIFNWDYNNGKGSFAPMRKQTVIK